MDVVIGPGSPDEAAALTELHHRAALLAFAAIFPSEAPTPDVEVDTARWREQLGADATGGHRSWVARTTAGSAVGVVLAGPDDDEPGIGHLSRLYVDPDWWGRGVGTRLYEVAVDDLAARFGAATLWVLEGNHRARAWYERLGWRLTDRRYPMYEPAGVDDVQYRIELPPPRS